jgi:hypothetical protein
MHAHAFFLSSPERPLAAQHNATIGGRVGFLSCLLLGFLSLSAACSLPPSLWRGLIAGRCRRPGGPKKNNAAFVFPAVCGVACIVGPLRLGKAAQAATKLFPFPSVVCTHRAREPLAPRCVRALLDPPATAASAVAWLAHVAEDDRPALTAMPRRSAGVQTIPVGAALAWDCCERGCSRRAVTWRRRGKALGAAAMRPLVRLQLVTRFGCTVLLGTTTASHGRGSAAAVAAACIPARQSRAASARPHPGGAC